LELPDEDFEVYGVERFEKLVITARVTSPLPMALMMSSFILMRVEMVQCPLRKPDWCFDKS